MNKHLWTLALDLVEKPAGPSFLWRTTFPPQNLSTAARPFPRRLGIVFPALHTTYDYDEGSL